MFSTIDLSEALSGPRPLIMTLALFSAWGHLWLLGQRLVAVGRLLEEGTTGQSVTASHID